jgi:hypothetical protein
MRIWSKFTRDDDWVYPMQEEYLDNSISLASKVEDEFELGKKN